MNDMILNLLANDSFTVSDFKAAGLTAENTKLESEEKYLQSQMIQENPVFKDESGNFSEDMFHQYYLQATSFYNKLADDTYLEDITKNTFYSKDNIFAPKDSPKIDETPRFVVSPNPFLQNNSLTRVGKRGDRQLSISEIAQSQKIYDSNKEEFKDESVNTDGIHYGGVFQFLLQLRMLLTMDYKYDYVYIVFDDSDITPNNHGVYFVGAVTTELYSCVIGSTELPKETKVIVYYTVESESEV